MARPCPVATTPKCLSWGVTIVVCGCLVLGLAGAIALLFPR
jgi:hypothetical protein